MHFRGEERVVRGKPTRITNDPAAVIPNSDVIVFAVPAFAHGGYLKAMAPHIRTKSEHAPHGRVIIGAMPGDGGFDMQVLKIFGKEKFDSVSLFALETLPWAVRLTDYGKSVEILGTKKDVEIAVSPASEGETVMAIVQKLMGQELPKLELIPCLLAVTLMNINQVI